MSKRKSLAILVLILGAMCLPAASIYAWQRSHLLSEDPVVKQALGNNNDSPVFSFKGIWESVRILEAIRGLTFVQSSRLVTT